MVTYSVQQTSYSCVVVNVSFSIVNSSFVFLLQATMKNSTLAYVTIIANFTNQGGFLGVNTHASGNTTISNCSFWGTLVSTQNFCSLLFNQTSSTSNISLVNDAFNATYTVTGNGSSIFGSGFTSTTLYTANLSVNFTGAITNPSGSLMYFFGMNSSSSTVTMLNLSLNSSISCTTKA